jgi:hypothetical protein
VAQKRAATAAAAEHVQCTSDYSSSAAQKREVSLAWQQLFITGKGSALADSLLKFSSLLCAVLPTRFCCNEPSCCCFDKPSELQLAAGKGVWCSQVLWGSRPAQGLEAAQARVQGCASSGCCYRTGQAEREKSEEGTKAEEHICALAMIMLCFKHS